MVTLIQWIEMNPEERKSLKVFGDNCGSDQDDYACYGKPCVCMVCRHEENFCIDYNTTPCYGCGGEDYERPLDFCHPDD